MEGLQCHSKVLPVDLSQWAVQPIKRFLVKNDRYGMINLEKIL